MTTPDLLALLLSDVQAFNAWRQANPDHELDLSGADLRGADLRGALLLSAKFDGARLDDAVLTGAALAGASFVGASFERADLRDTQFTFAELFDAKLLGTALGSRLSYGADLSDASLVAARASGANFKECQLSGVDVTDCDLRGADLRRTALADLEHTQPPSIEASDEAFWARFRELPLEVREGLALFTGMVFIASGQQQELVPAMLGIVETLGFDQEAFRDILPSGEIRLESMKIKAPESRWCQRVWLALMCGLITAGNMTNMQLQVIGHFGEQLDYTDRAMARIMSAELGIEISTS